MAGGKMQLVAAGQPTKKNYVFKPTKALKKYVHKEINKAIETKERNIIVSESDITNTSQYPYRITMTDIAAGRDDNQRVGNEVQMTKLQYKLFMHNKTNFDSVVRVVVLRPKANLNNTDMDAGLQLFKDGNGTLDFEDATPQQRLVKDIDRTSYTVLSDKLIKLGAQNSNAKDNNKIIRFKKTYKRHKLSWEDQSSTVCNNPIKVMFWNIDSALDTNTVTFELTGETSLYYKDA